MSTVVLTGIGLLTTQTAEFGDLPIAAVLIDGDRIAWVGPAGS
ncbi:MAG: imidazolonepropionase, partial [Geodermatophilaceae bacterium]|nr:imidazolonepropionase [Geodermatophilaceae bacterium]